MTVHTAQEQRDLQLSGMIHKARRQLGLLRIILVVISAIIMVLILYTLTLDEIHDIALLKLIGGRNQVITSSIMHYALFLGATGFGIAYLLGLWIFPSGAGKSTLLTAMGLIKWRFCNLQHWKMIFQAMLAACGGFYAP